MPSAPATPTRPRHSPHSRCCFLVCKALSQHRGRTRRDPGSLCGRGDTGPCTWEAGSAARRKAVREAGMGGHLEDWTQARLTLATALGPTGGRETWGHTHTSVTHHKQPLLSLMQKKDLFPEYFHITKPTSLTGAGLAGGAGAAGSSRLFPMMATSLCHPGGQPQAGRLLWAEAGWGVVGFWDRACLCTWLPSPLPWGGGHRCLALGGPWRGGPPQRESRKGPAL